MVIDIVKEADMMVIDSVHCVQVTKQEQSISLHLPECTTAFDKTQRSWILASCAASLPFKL